VLGGAVSGRLILTDQSVIIRASAAPMRRLMIRAPMPKIVDRTERQQALIQAAMSVFAEHGYHGATMQDVAERAGVSKGGIYDYFTSKEELLLRTADVLISALFEQSMQILERDDAPIRTRVERFVGSLMGDLDAWTDVCFAILQVWAELGRGEDQPLRALMGDLYRRSADRMQAVFDDAVERGEACPFPTRAAAFAIMAALDGSLLQAIVVADELRAATDDGLLVRWCASIVPVADREIPG
jgi:AcrR family transcriptional regulator